MSTPFPGMDPYLERRGLWEGVHTRLLVALADAIAPQVRPRYRVDVEQRTYLAVMTPDDLIGKPDVLVLATREPRVAYHTVSPAWACSGRDSRVAYARRGRRALS